jgi:hypothetical protein
VEFFNLNGLMTSSELHAGKIFIANCYTQAAESSDGPTISHRQRVVLASNEKEPPILSEEEPEESSGAGDDSESDIDYTPRGRAEDPTVIEKTFPLYNIYLANSATAKEISEAKEHKTEGIRFAAQI